MPGLETALVRKLDAFVELTGAEKVCLAELQSPPFAVKRGKELLQEGHAGNRVVILRTGWASSYKDLPDGARQIINFPVPGDCVGLRSVLLRTSDHSFAALTDAQVSFVEATRMLELLDDSPRLRAAFLWSAARDEAMTVEHLVSIGRRNALERTAYFFMELAERLKLVGLAEETEFRCPLNQYVLADALGLSAIHVNRVLRLLRELNLLTLKAGKVFLLDIDGLRKLAGYRPMSVSRNRTLANSR